MKKILLLILLPISAFAQKDIQFWFAAPDVEQLLVNDPRDRPIYLRLTSFGNSANVTISVPANASFTPISISLAANSYGTIDLSPFITQIENTTANVIANKGILIQSTADITAYYEVLSACQCNPELFALKGKNALGTEFLIPSQTEWPVDSIRMPNARSAFNIVATENNTSVTITPSRTLIGRPPGVPFTVNLNRGQTFSAQALYRSGNSLLNGSIVTANKPIAVTADDDLLMADGPCADLAGDQLIPTSIWGNEFVVIKGALTNKDKIIVSAMTNGTNVYLNGGATPAATINRGGSYEINLTALTSYIKADKNISVYHYTGINCEIGSAVVPKLNCTGSTDISVTRSFDQATNVYITTRNGFQSGFSVNGNNSIITAADFQPVPGTAGNFVYCRKNLSSALPVGSPSRFTNTLGKFQFGILNGDYIPNVFGGCSYGFFSDFKSSSVTRSYLETCKTDSVQLNAFGGISYQWSPATGLSNTTIANPKALPAASTQYKVIITTPEGCIDSAFIHIVVNDCVPQPLLCNNWLATPSAPSYAEMGDLDVPGNQLTVEAVFNRTAPIIGGDLYAGNLVSKHSNPTTVNYLLRPNSAEITTTNGYFIAQSPCGIELNITYHVAMVYDGATLKFYRNGDLLKQIAVTGDLYQSDLKTRVGYLDYDPPLTENFIGYINEVRIWNVARTQSDIRAYMQTNLPNPTNQNGLLGYYSFDNLVNKQGNSAFNAVLAGSASLGKINPNCNFAPNGGVPTASAGEDAEYCSNSPVTHQLNGSGNGVSYSWQPVAYLNNPSIANPIATVATTTNFFLTVTNANGCSKTDTVTVFVKPLPNLTTFSDTAVCSNATLNLSATGANTYTWSPASSVSNQNIANPLFVGTSSQLITLTGKNSQGCSSTKSFMVNVKQAPKVTTIADSTICNNQTITLTTTGAQTYSWSPATNLSSSSISNPLFSGNVGGAYIVTGTISSGCSAKDTVVINVVPAPNLVTFKDTSVCSNQILNLLATGANSYSWSPTSSVSNPSIGNPIFTGNSSQTLVVTGTSGVCTKAQSFNVVYKQAPIVSSIPDTSICSNNSIVLATTGAQSYSWTPGTNLSNANASSPLFSGNSGGVYVVTGTAYNGCTAKDTVVISILPSPNLTAFPDTSVCTNKVLNLIASGANTYSWLPLSSVSNPSIPNPIFIGNASQYLTVSGLNGEGCITTKSFNVTLKQAPIVKTISDTSVCSNSSIILATSGAQSYSWLPVVNLDNPNISSPLFSGNLNTVYTVTGIANNGCSANDTVAINVRPNPKISKSPDDSICLGQSITLNVSGGTTYSWSPTSTLNNANIANPIATPTLNTMYYINATTNNCSTRDSVFIKVTPLPFFTVSPPTATCVNGSAKLSASGGDQYSWSPATYLNNSQVSNPVAKVNVNTIFTVIIKNNTCKLSDTLTTLVTTDKAPPDVRAFKASDIDCVFSQSQLNASGADIYTWTPAIGLNNPKLKNPIATPTKNTLYTVTGIDSVTNCKSTDTISVLIKGATDPKAYIPNSFTPNGDGVNDCFRVRDYGTIKFINIIIYNRYGNLVYASKNMSECWDGTYKGQPAEQGNYVYYIKSINDCGEEITKGNLILLR